MCVSSACVEMNSWLDFKAALKGVSESDCSYFGRGGENSV